MSDLLFTLLEAARLLRVEPRTLSQWARAGHVRAFRTPGGQWRFRRSDLEQALTADNEGRHARHR